MKIQIQIQMQIRIHTRINMKIQIQIQMQIRIRLQIRLHTRITEMDQDCDIRMKKSVNNTLYSSCPNSTCRARVRTAHVELVSEQHM
jgi:hypothetical protein